MSALPTPTTFLSPKPLARVAALGLAVGLLAGCAAAPQTIMLGPARPAITTAEGVRIYESMPRGAQEIALIEGRSVGELRAKAAALGANGLIPGGVVPKPGPHIGIGIGGSSYRFGRRSATAVGTSAMFDIPTGGSVMEGTAIYVPRGRSR